MIDSSNCSYNLQLFIFWIASKISITNSLCSFKDFSNVAPIHWLFVILNFKTSFLFGTFNFLIFDLIDISLSLSHYLRMDRTYCGISLPSYVWDFGLSSKMIPVLVLCLINIFLLNRKQCINQPTLHKEKYAKYQKILDIEILS